MTGTIPKSEVLTGPERRRRWAPAEKLAIVAETYEPGMSVSLVARRHGIANSTQDTDQPATGGRNHVILPYDTISTARFLTLGFLETFLSTLGLHKAKNESVAQTVPA